jgi:hypothetical protein
LLWVDDIQLYKNFNYPEHFISQSENKWIVNHLSLLNYKPVLLSAIFPRDFITKIQGMFELIYL